MTNHIEELKQLARKTQECEELKSQIETYSKMLLSYAISNV